MIYLSPSLMCADLFDLNNEIRLLESGKCDMLHIDIMDYHFVPNLCFGIEIVKQLHIKTILPLDIHLMVEKPENIINTLPMKENDYVSFHYEATNFPIKIIECIHNKAAKAGIALSPCTPFSAIKNILPYIDFILIMTVEPGFSGQKFIDSMYDKIHEASEYIKKHHLDILIEVDGNISFETGKRCFELGAEVFVGGTSSIFKPNKHISQMCINFRNYLNLKGN